MKTLFWCSRLVLSLWPRLHMCCAAWHPMQGTVHTLRIPTVRATERNSTWLFISFTEESSSCWWNFSWKIEIILHTQVKMDLKLKMWYRCSSKTWLTVFFVFCFLIFYVTVQRIVIPRLLPALSRGFLGQLWPHAEDSADWVQRPQTDPHTQGGGFFFSFQVSSSNCRVWLSFQSPVFLANIFPMILQGADGVEYLLVAVDANTLMDFLENEEGDWDFPGRFIMCFGWKTLNIPSQAHLQWINIKYIYL